MTILYIICALLCMGAILCNQYACVGEQRMQGGWLILSVVVALTPFLNAIYVLAMVAHIVKGRKG